MKPATLICQIGVLISALVEVSLPQESSGWQEDDCRRALREAKSVKVEAQTPPKLVGHWTSYGCEIRPGPEFVLRKYVFRRNSFNAQLFYYADEACTKVTHSFTAKGSFRPMRNSWRTPGAYEAKYRSTQVVAIPYTIDQAKFFEKIMHRYCKPVKGISVKAFRKFKIFQFTKYSKDKREVDDSDFDCSKVFNFTMNELQLVRVERRHSNKLYRTNDVIQNQVRGRTETELLLGDISTNIKYRQQYRPTHYQVPLKKSKTVGCDICAKIANSSQWRPPILQSHDVTSTDIYGEWVSRRCETRPNGQYLTRTLTFRPGGRSWIGVYDFYKDSVCQKPHFSLDVKGNYVRGLESRDILSANNYVFRTTRLKITARDFQMVQYLNTYGGNGCGKTKEWKIGITQDVTSTYGCLALGIKLPNIEYEIMKSETEGGVSYLYVGQRPNDFASLSARKNRPTSFQSPLVKCGNHVNYDISSKHEEVIIKHMGNHKYFEISNPTPNLTMYLVSRNAGISVTNNMSCLSVYLIILFLIHVSR